MEMNDFITSWFRTVACAGHSRGSVICHLFKSFQGRDHDFTLDIFIFFHQVCSSESHSVVKHVDRRLRILGLKC